MCDLSNVMFKGKRDDKKRLRHLSSMWMDYFKLLHYIRSLSTARSDLWESGPLSILAVHKLRKKHQRGIQDVQGPYIACDYYSTWLVSPRFPNLCWLGTVVPSWCHILKCLDDLQSLGEHVIIGIELWFSVCKAYTLISILFLWSQTYFFIIENSWFCPVFQKRF